MAKFGHTPSPFSRFPPSHQCMHSLLAFRPQQNISLPSPLLHGQFPFLHSFSFPLSMCAAAFKWPNNGGGAPNLASKSARGDVWRRPYSARASRAASEWLPPQNRWAHARVCGGAKIMAKRKRREKIKESERKSCLCMAMAMAMALASRVKRSQCRPRIVQFWHSSAHPLRFSPLLTFIPLAAFCPHLLLSFLPFLLFSLLLAKKEFLPDGALPQKLFGPASFKIDLAQTSHRPHPLPPPTGLFQFFGPHGTDQPPPSHPQQWPDGMPNGRREGGGADGKTKHK